MTQTYKNHTVTIEQDIDAESPREWSNLGTMVCSHSRYPLGDEQITSTFEEALYEILIDLDPDLERIVGYHEDRRDIRAQTRAIQASGYRHLLFLPLYLFDHSQLALSTVEFACPWDSGQVGYIYATLEQVRTEFGVSRISRKTRLKAYDILRTEVGTYDADVRGEVYTYAIDGEECDDACGGFFGDPNGYILEEAKAVIDVALTTIKGD